MQKLHSKHLKIWLCTVFVFVLNLNLVLAQNKTISGTITDQDGKPLAGATIKAKGAKSATTISNEDGTFSFSVPNQTNRLTVSFTGYEDEDFEFGNKSSNIEIKLKFQTAQLEDVVVVGYGTRKIKDATGSVTAIGPKDFNKGVIPTVDNLFQGRVSGVNVTTASGEPGAEFNINIRGANSIRANANPLFVIDGVPLSGEGNLNSSNFGDASTARNPLSFLNPNDIANITFLKDASSAAIYGSRGANGVVLITTKNGRGANQGLTISLNGSVSDAYKKYDLANASQFVSGLQALLPTLGLTPTQVTDALKVLNKGNNTDWQDEVLRQGYTKNLNLGWGTNSKDGKSSLRLSLDYFDQQGIVKNQNLDRLTFRSNFIQDQFLGLEKLKLEFNITASKIHNDYPGIGNNSGYQGSLIGAALGYNPTYPIYNPDGTLFDSKDGNRNPVAILKNFKDYDNSTVIVSNVALNYKIWDNFVYRANFGFEGRQVERDGFIDPRLSVSEYGARPISELGQQFPNSDAATGQAQKVKSKQNNVLQEHTLTYNNAFKYSNLNVVLGYSYQSFENFTNRQRFWGLENPDHLETNFANYSYSTPVFAYQGDSNSSKLQSFFGRINWDLLDRYFFTLTVRTDGSSRFATNNQYATFPAAAFKWRILNEEWAQGASKVLDNLDFRLNYGITGNQEFGNYYSLGLAYTNFVGGSNVVQLANPYLKWEQTLTAGGGIDFGLLQGIISGSIDYFSKNTSNLLLPVINAQPAPSGLQWKNLDGNVLNKGVELSLNFQIFKPKNYSGFGWNINANFTSVKNEVVNLKVPYLTGEVSGQGLSGARAQIFTSGKPLFTWKMPVFEGYDANGYGIYANGGADQLLGTALPTYYGGLTNNFSLGRFTASVFIAFQGGNYIYNNTANAIFTKGSFKNGRNVTVDVINSPESSINPGSVSTRFLEKGDFVRLQNLNIAYNVKLPASIALKSLNIGLTGQNLFLFSGYSGLDPEVNVAKPIGGIPSRGFDYAGTPRARTFTLSINIGF